MKLSSLADDTVAPFPFSVGAREFCFDACGSEGVSTVMGTIEGV
jgi:hypothetical protein